MIQVYQSPQKYNYKQSTFDQLEKIRFTYRCSKRKKTTHQNCLGRLWCFNEIQV